MYKYIIQKAAAFLILISSAVCLLSPLSAFCESGQNQSDMESREDTVKSEPQTIRVAYPIQEGLTYIDENGDYSGYTYEYLQEIAQYTGWNYDFITPEETINESLTNLMEMLENGEIDVMGATVYNESLAQIYDYAAQSYGNVYTVLQVLENNTIDYILPNSEDVTRVAVLENAISRNRELEEYCKMYNIKTELVYCKSHEQQIAALENGSADAMLNVSMNFLENLRTIARFSPRPFYFVTTKGRSDIVNQLNEAIYSIESTDPYFSTTMFEKYFTEDYDNLTLSSSEKSFIENAGVIRVGMTANFPPFQYTDTSSDTIKGISKDLLDYISDKTGLKFEIVPADSQESLLRMIEKHEVDIVSGIVYDYESAREKNVVMSRPYITTQYIMAVNDKISKDSINGKRLALPKSSYYKGYFLGEVHYYDTFKECIKAVSSGEADYTYANSYSVQYYINRPEYSNLNLIPQTYMDYRMCFGVVKPGNSTLLNILNKIINHISSDKLQSIIYNNTTYRHDVSLSYIMRKNPIQSILIITAVCLCIIAVLLWGLISRIKMGGRIKLELKKRDMLYELVNKYFFEYDCRTGIIEITKHTNSDVHKKISYSSEIPDNITNEADRKNYKKFFEVINSREDGIQEVRLACGDGKPHWIQIAMKTIYNSKNLPVYTIGTIRNIDDAREEKDKLLDLAQRDSLTRISVSYTHLDVYKRQPHHQAIHRLQIRPLPKQATRLLRQIPPQN